MQPIRETNRPSLVVHLVDKGAILGRYAKGGDARHAIGVGRSVQGTGGAGAGTNGSKVGGRRIRGTSGGRGARECLVESLANHFRVCFIIINYDLRPYLEDEHTAIRLRAWFVPPSSFFKQACHVEVKLFRRGIGR